MKHVRAKKLMSLALTFAMLISLVPVVRVAAEDPPGTTVGSNFMLNKAFTMGTVSAYCQEGMGPRENFYGDYITLGYTSDSPLEWMMLGFSLANNQQVKLELWTLDEAYKGQNPMTMLPDLEDPDTPEEFLG